MNKGKQKLITFTKNIILLYLLLITILTQLDLAIRLPKYVTDFCQDYIAAKNLMKGKSIYERNECWSGTGFIKAYTAPHPPFSIMLFAPFTFLTLSQAMLAWLLVSWILYAAAIAIILKLFNKLRAQYILLVLFISLFYSPFRESLTTQNVVHLLLLLLTASVYLQIKKRDFASGIFIGIAIQLRIWPLLFALPALMAKKTNYLSGVLLIISIGTLITLLFGKWQDYFFYLGPVSRSEGIFILSANNLSLSSLIAKTIFNSGFSINEAVSHAKTVTVIIAVLLYGFVHFIAYKKIASEKTFILTQSLCLSLILYVFPVVWGWIFLIYAFCYILNIYIIKGMPKPPVAWRVSFISSVFFLIFLKIYNPARLPSYPNITSEQYFKLIDAQSIASLIGVSLFVLSQLILLKFIRSK